MHFEILNNHQIELLPYLGNFKRTFFLVGGTAIAFHIGHRRSIDFDLFTHSPLVLSRIRTKLNQIPYNQIPIFQDYDQLHLQLNNVKVTFFSFPYSISHPIKIQSYLSMPSLLTLASMKAFALGRRAKWKDYVDLFFILKNNYSIQDICREAEINFGSQFSEKLFRQQLAFHKDIDYSEQVEYLVPAVSEKEIRTFLIDKATELDFLN